MRDAELLVDISESCGTKPGFPLSHSQNSRRLDGGPNSWLQQRPMAAHTLLNENLLLTITSPFLCILFNFCWDHLHPIYLRIRHQQETRTFPDSRAHAGGSWVSGLALPVGLVVQCCDHPAGGDVASPPVPLHKNNDYCYFLITLSLRRKKKKSHSNLLKGL